MASNAKPLTNLELSSFCSQMAMILKAGISPLEGISIMNEEPGGKDENQLLTEMESVINQTGSLSEAIKSSNVFPEYFVHMTEIGEQAGKLDDVMDSLSVYYDREAQIAGAIKQAVTYPFVMIAMMMGVVLMLIMKVLPAFNDAFMQLGHELTGFSKTVLQFGQFLNRYSYVLMGVFAVLLLIFFYFANTTSGRRIFVHMMRTFGWGKKVSHLAAACRVASGMSIILSSGLNIEHSMELATALVDDPDYKNRMDNISKEMQEGKSFDEAIKKANIFSGIYVQMATVGYKTGTMDEVMHKISGHYEDELDAQITRVISILEPTLVIILSVVVGAVLLSVMLPLLGIMASF